MAGRRAARRRGLKILDVERLSRINDTLGIELQTAAGKATSETVVGAGGIGGVSKKRRKKVGKVAKRLKKRFTSLQFSYRDGVHPSEAPNLYLFDTIMDMRGKYDLYDRLPWSEN